VSRGVLPCELLLDKYGEKQTGGNAIAEACRLCRNNAHLIRLFDYHGICITKRLKIKL
jgi:hypothetical protein